MTEEIQPQEQIQAKENDVEINLAKQRKMYERKLQEIELEKQRILDENKEIKEAYERRMQNNEEEEIDDEYYVDTKKLNKTLSKFEENIYKKNQEVVNRAVSEALDNERRQAYLKENNDFNKVMNEETIEKFAEQHPALAEAILKMPNTFERQKLVYENIKAFGVDKGSQKPTVQDKINQNKQHPGYQPSGFAGSAYSNQGDFSKSGQKLAYEKMKDLQSRMRLS